VRSLHSLGFHLYKYSYKPHEIVISIVNLLRSINVGVPRPGGPLGRRVSVAACPSPDGSSARASAKGGRSEAVGDRRERGGNPAAFVFVPRPGRVRLQ
jgi:hypothetical protein